MIVPTEIIKIIKINQKKEKTLNITEKCTFVKNEIIMSSYLNPIPSKNKFSLHLGDSNT
jgi:hypothetical protein